MRHKIDAIWFVLVLIAMIAGCSALGGGDDDDSDSSTDDDASDDDVSADDDASGGSMYSDACGIDYGANPGCNSSDPACQMAMLINQDRYQNPQEADCAPAIKWNDALADVALAHSTDMCNRNFFDHVNPDGQDPFDRMTAAGIQFVAAGENIAMGTGLTVSQAEDMFMDEPECTPNHRSNILDRDFTDAGVGVYDRGAFVYITQDFASFNFSDIRTDPNEYCGD